MPNGDEQTWLRDRRLTLEITPERKDLCGRLVDAHDALVSDLEHVSECGPVHCHFRSRNQFREAANLFLRLAVRYAKLDSRMRDDLTTIATAFSAVRIVAVSPPNLSGAAEQPAVLDRAQQTLTEISEIGDQVLRLPAGAHGRLARQAQAMNRGLWTLDDLERGGGRLEWRHPDVSGSPPPPFVNPIRDRIVGLGRANDPWPGTAWAPDWWFAIPWDLALAPEVVATCRRIASVSTAEPQFRFRLRESIVGNYYRRIFSECRPAYYIPGDESISNVGHVAGKDLRELLDEFLPPLRQFLEEAFGQPVENAGNAVTVRFSLTGVIFVNDEPERRPLSCKVLMATAILAEPEATEVPIDTWEFVELVYGRRPHPPSIAWNRDKAALEAVGLGVEFIRERHYRIFNFRFFFGPGVTKQWLREKLAASYQSSDEG